MPRKRTATVLISVTILIFFTLSLVVATAYTEARSAKKQVSNLLVIVAKVGVGKTPISGAQEELRSFSNVLGSKTRNGEGDDYRAYVFDNARLARLHLSKYRRFVVRLTYHDGLLIEKVAEASVEGDCRVAVTERFRQSTATESEQPNHFNTVPTNFDHPVAVATIIDDDLYDETSKRQDWQFNLDYLTSVSGCRDARTILPSILR